MAARSAEADAAPHALISCKPAKNSVHWNRLRKLVCIDGSRVPFTASGGCPGVRVLRLRISMGVGGNFARTRTRLKDAVVRLRSDATAGFGGHIGGHFSGRPPACSIFQCFRILTRFPHIRERLRHHGGNALFVVPVHRPTIAANRPCSRFEPILIHPTPARAMGMPRH